MMLQCLRRICAMYFVLVFYGMEKMGRLFVLGLLFLVSNSGWVYCSALLKLFIMVLCLYTV